MQQQDGASRAWKTMTGQVLDLIDHSSEIRLRRGSSVIIEARSSRHDPATALQEQRAVECVLTAVSRRLADTSAPDILRAIETSLSELVEVLGYDRCSFSELIAGDYLNVLCSCATGDTERLPRGRFPHHLPWFVGQVRAGRTVALSNLPDDLPAEAVEEREHCRKSGLRSFLCIPVRVGRRVTSTLTFAAMQHSRAWLPATVARLTMLGELLGGVLALARAEEEARELRRRAWHADRVERVSLLAATIAHELNQPLAAILNNAQAGLKHLSREDADPRALCEILESVVREDKRAAETIRTMRALVSKEESQREVVDVAAALGEIQRLLASEFAANGVRLETRFDIGCRAMADKVQVGQVGLNLLLNAMAAVQCRPPAERLVQIEVCRVAGERISVSVRDAGRGIASADLEAIFEPFWTTGKSGLGLGLAICRAIVESHEGRIWAEPNALGGATFRVEFPAAPCEPDKVRRGDFRTANKAVASDRLAAANEREERALVCVIDDDPDVRQGLVRLLGEEGWLAKPYASADEFLAEPPAAEVACLLLDIRMPGSSGLELQRHLVLTTCAPAIIFITGQDDVAASVDAMKLGAADYLVKPVDARVLVEAVAKAVDHYHARREQAHSQSTLMRRISSLSTRERQIMEHVIEGRLNKQIAADLLITEQTVKQHRGRVMDKMEVKSVAQLVRACEATGLFPASALK
ncbi:ATP-binding protein [Variovorax rhizosphaerae]|uniref:histidine kinase n=1 Tax=Variovorax rhizosphaerae TaxID=1836200 RepID=A0ABU8WTI2_9BURK